MTFIIREATKEDAYEIHRVIAAAFEKYRSFYTNEAFNDTISSKEGIENRLDNSTIFIAVNDKQEIIGTIGWQKVTKNEAHIRGMAVLPQYQGKNSPASLLIKKVEEEAKKHSCLVISLDTTEILQRAQRFYSKHGFQKTRKTGDFFGNTIIEFIKKI